MRRDEGEGAGGLAAVRTREDEDLLEEFGREVREGGTKFTWVDGDSGVAGVREQEFHGEGLSERFDDLVKLKRVEGRRRTSALNVGV